MGPELWRKLAWCWQQMSKLKKSQVLKPVTVVGNVQEKREPHHILIPSFCRTLVCGEKDTADSPSVIRAANWLPRILQPLHLEMQRLFVV